jgi:uncharacterized protein DUF6074
MKGGRQFRFATVSAFPPARRRDLVLRVAEAMAKRPSDLGEAYLKNQLERQVVALQRKRVPTFEIKRELRSFELAVRAELWRQIICPPIRNPPDDAA